MKYLKDHFQTIKSLNFVSSQYIICHLKIYETSFDHLFSFILCSEKRAGIISILICFKILKL